MLTSSHLFFLAAFSKMCAPIANQKGFMTMSMTMATMDLRLQEGVHILTLTNAENDNQFTLDVLKEYITAFDEVAAYEGNTALVITCEHDKTWTTGINLEWLMQQGPDAVNEFRVTLEAMMYQLAMLNAPTLACINGNAYAGGALLFAAADFRYMRADRGRICFPEIDIKIPFTPMMHDLLEFVPNAQLLKRMALLGERITGQQAWEAGVVDGLFSVEELQEKAIEFAQLLATKDRASYTTIKHGLKRQMLKWEEEHGQSL